MVLFRIAYLAFNFVEQSYFYILVIHVYKITITFNICYLYIFCLTCLHIKKFIFYFV